MKLKDKIKYILKGLIDSIFILLLMSIPLTIIYVPIHFIIKYW